MTVSCVVFEMWAARGIFLTSLKALEGICLQASFH